MGIEGFLKVPDIPGGETRRNHEGEIEVHGVTFSMEAPHEPLGGARKGRATVDNVVFTKYYDQSSPYLKKALFDNTRLAQVVFSVLRTTEGNESDYLVVTLKDAAVTNYAMQPADVDSALIEERVGFNFQTITFTYDGSHEVQLDLRTTR